MKRRWEGSRQRQMMSLRETCAPGLLLIQERLACCYIITVLLLECLRLSGCSGLSHFLIWVVETRRGSEGSRTCWLFQPGVRSKRAPLQRIVGALCWRTAGPFPAAAVGMATAFRGFVTSQSAESGFKVQTVLSQFEERRLGQENPSVLHNSWQSSPLPPIESTTFHPQGGGCDYGMLMRL